MEISFVRRVIDVLGADFSIGGTDSGDSRNSYYSLYYKRPQRRWWCSPHVAIAMIGVDKEGAAFAQSGDIRLLNFLEEKFPNVKALLIHDPSMVVPELADRFSLSDNYAE